MDQHPKMLIVLAIAVLAFVYIVAHPGQQRDLRDPEIPATSIRPG